MKSSSMLNERTGHFYKAVHCKGDETDENKSPNGLKNIDDLALKGMYRYILVFFGVQCFR